MPGGLEEEQLLGGRIVLQRGQSGELEELDGKDGSIHLEFVADNALQIAFYASATSNTRFVVRIRSGSQLRVVGEEEP